MATLSNVLVYHWRAWPGFLISHLVDKSNQLPARYEDDISQFEQALTANIKAVLLQINLSRSEHFPELRSQLISDLQQRGLLVLNQFVGDITKHNLHKMLHAAEVPNVKVPQQGDGDEWLFVKTNLNWGGEIEQSLPTALLPRFSDSSPRTLQRHNQYYKRQRKNLAPSLWQDDSVVIEKYIDNPEDSFYRVYAFGNAVVVVKAHSKDLVKKISGDDRDCNYFYRRDQIINDKTQLPVNLQHTIAQFLRNIRLDYFCLDIVHNQTDYYVIDLNLTPYAGIKDQTTEATEYLIAGANDYIDRHFAANSK
ncbi:MAG: hypothetical protein ACI8WB_001069 [Phenylobacterium sp.]|jgi:hypothetical protein